MEELNTVPEEGKNTELFFSFILSLENGKSTGILPDCRKRYARLNGEICKKGVRVIAVEDKYPWVKNKNQRQNVRNPKVLWE